MYYTNKPIEKTVAPICGNPSAEIKNLLSGLPVHSIEVKDEKHFAPSANANMNYDTDAAQLTDGKYSPDNQFPNPEWFRMHNGLGRAITFKLPCLCAVSGFSMDFCRDDAPAVRIPRYVNIRVSADGESFETVYENPNTRSFRDRRKHCVKGEFEPTQALYVQFVFDVVNHIFIDEIELYGCTDANTGRAPVADNKPLFREMPTSPVVNEFPPEDILGAGNITLTYNYRPFEPDKGLQTEADYLPLVAYLDKDGKILDTFMDGYLFLPDVTFVFHKEGQNAKGWKEYVDYTFYPDRNVDALNKTVGKVKEALNLPDYKASVYYTILYTYTGDEAFGELDGETLVFDNIESRKKAIKWMIDTMVKRHNEGGYNNTEIKGFYWFEELINPSDICEEELIHFAGDYVRSLGYKLFWIPYYIACGYDAWKTYGLDIACMQPNYAFDANVPKSRLYDTAAEAKRLGMSVELEVWKIQEDANGNIDNPDNIERFMNYLRAGAETGFMNTVKMYYHGSAPGGVITNGWKSKNPAYREMYDTCYLFAKKKLK